jgi:hypothetical protein
LRNLNL